MEEKIKCPKCNTANPAANNYCLSCGSLIKTSLVATNQKCPFCSASLSEKDFFCPICGKKIREKPLSSTIWTQAWIYFISFCLPPLGLWPGFKYLRQNDPKLKTIGAVAIVLTVISILISAVIAISLINQVNDQVNKQMLNLMQF